MKLHITLIGCILLMLSAATPASSAVVYCQYVGVPKGCVARPGVVLRAAPGVGAPGVGVGARGVGVAPGVGVNTPTNRGGPVDRAGRR